MDSRENRKAVAESILTGIKTNNDTFPETGDLFIEKLVEWNQGKMETVSPSMMDWKWYYRLILKGINHEA